MGCSNFVLTSEQFDRSLMIFLSPRKRQRLAHEVTQALARRVVPALDVQGFSRILAEAAVSAAQRLLVGVASRT